MKLLLIIPVLTFYLAFNTTVAENNTAEITEVTPIWKVGVDVEEFWQNYVTSKGGLTWKKSVSYPPFNKVKEGDTFLVEVAQGSCLMEFFHNRWRRANDVRRWDESVNDYGGCPHVFD